MKGNKKYLIILAILGIFAVGCTSPQPAPIATETSAAEAARADRDRRMTEWFLRLSTKVEEQRARTK